MKGSLVARLVVIILAAAPLHAQAQQPAQTRAKDYSAQRKPRILVAEFQNTNTEAIQRKYGESVSAMLVTHLKRHSQLVAVERQRAQLLQEWAREQSGAVAALAVPTPIAPAPPLAPALSGAPGTVPVPGAPAAPGTPAVPGAPAPAPAPAGTPVTPGVPAGAAAPAGLTALPLAATDPLAEAGAPARPRLLEFVDAILEGRVTVLASCQAGSGNAAAAAACTSGSDEIEIDARLISTDDGHIISVGHQRGKASSLRDTVAMLGVELENGFLRPYYGSLTIAVPEPTNVRVWLTPVLRTDASDDEIPPVELDRSVTNQGQSRAILLDKWVTSPTVATIGSLLGGWYTVRLERPGYEGVSTDNGRIVLPALLGQATKPTRREGGALTAEQESFLVRIAPGETTKWPSDGRRVALRKKGGSLLLQVKREFLDKEFRPASEVLDFKTYVHAELAAAAAGDEPKALLDVNSTEDFESVADGPFLNVSIVRRLNMRTSCEYRAQQGMFDQFSGGRLLLEDYHQVASSQERRLPTGQYRVSAVHKNYVPFESGVVDVADGDQDRPVQIELRRMRGTIEVEYLGVAMPGRTMVLEGRETKFRQVVPLDFTGKRTIPNMPVDVYAVTMDLPGFEASKSALPIKDVPVRAEANETTCAVALPDIKEERPWNRPTRAFTFAFTLKTQPWLGGRLSRMKRFPVDGRNVLARDNYERLLDQLTKARERQTAGSGNRAATTSLVVGATAGAEIQEQDAVQQLRDFLWSIDLLYLDDADMQRLLKLPEAAAVIKDYIANGGAVFAFISTPGDYASILGTAVPLDPKKKTMRDELEIRGGDVSQVQLNMKIEFKPQREFPTFDSNRKDVLSSWRVLAYRRGGRNEPAIIETGVPEKGGYVVVWLDSLSVLPQDGIAGEMINEALAAVENRAFAWAQSLMYRKYGPDSARMREASDALARFTVSMNKQTKIEP